MSFCWLVLAGERPESAAAAAEAEGIGDLAAWPADAAEPPGALRIDARAIDPRGAAALVSLVLAPPGISIPFDDPAVSHALRCVLAGPRSALVSTLLVEEVRFAGAITAVRGEDPGAVFADPFARVFPRRIVRVDAGLLGEVPAPTGPGIARYRGGSPWPWDRF